MHQHESYSKNKHQRLRRRLRRYVELQKLRREPSNGEFETSQNQSQRTELLNVVANRVNDTNARPEETYEIWEGLEYVNSNLKGRQNVQTIAKSSKISGQTGTQDFEDNANRNNIDDETNEDNDGNTNKELDLEIRTMLDSTDARKSWVKSKFLVAINGLETFPESKTNYTLYHTKNLRNLLHISILRRNWPLAYRLFCLLIRMNHVDIRTVWPLGIEILRHVGKGSALVAKDERFFEWLSNFFTISKASLNLIRDISAPIWRSGSKYHVPLYIMSFMWLLLARRKYAKMLDKLEELVLEPPFNSEGVFFYLQALGILGQATEEKRITDNNVTKIRQSIATATKLGFVVPMEYLNDKLKSFDETFIPEEPESGSELSDSSRNDIRSNEIYHISPYGYENNDAEHIRDSITDAKIVMDDNFMPFDSEHEINSLE